MTEDALLALLRALRDRVVGITDTALASRDGLIITSDTADIDPDNLAALAAASLGLAQRMSAEAARERSGRPPRAAAAASWPSMR